METVLFRVEYGAVDGKPFVRITAGECITDLIPSEARELADILNVAAIHSEEFVRRGTIPRDIPS